MNESAAYVHGYEGPEAARLNDQSVALETLLHPDIRYGDGSKILEIGCGTGAQTVILGRNSPGAAFVSVDTSAVSLGEAVARARAASIGNVEFIEADIFDLPFEPLSFDHIFVCFVLEHLSDPLTALQNLRRFLRPKGSITVIEGDHATAIYHPQSLAAQAAIGVLEELQRAKGGDPFIGRRLYPLLAQAGFGAVEVKTIPVYADGASPGLREMFTIRTFTAMIEGVREEALAKNLMTTADFDEGLAALRRTAEPDGVFCYTFFRGVAYNLSALQDEQ